MYSFCCTDRLLLLHKKLFLGGKHAHTNVALASDEIDIRLQYNTRRKSLRCYCFSRVFYVCYHDRLRARPQSKRGTEECHLSRGPCLTQCPPKASTCDTDRRDPKMNMQRSREAAKRPVRVFSTRRFLAPNPEGISCFITFII